MSKRYARIKKDASAIFMREQRKVFKNQPLPTTYQAFYYLLRDLAGQTLEIDQEYGNRIGLKYKEPIVEEDGTLVVGIDLAKNLVEML